MFFFVSLSSFLKLSYDHSIRFAHAMQGLTNALRVLRIVLIRFYFPVLRVLTFTSLSLLVPRLQQILFLLVGLADLKSAEFQC